MDDTSKYRELFFEETDEYLQTLNDCLLQLEKDPNETSLLDEIFRAAHTLKGMAATMGYTTMTELTHHMENVFELFRNGSSTINSDVISLIFRCFDKLSEIVEDLREEKNSEFDIKDLVEELDNLTKGDEKTVTVEGELSFKASDVHISDSDKMVIEEARNKDFSAYNIAIKLSEGCLLKGARAYLITNKLEQQGDLLHTEPSPDKLEEGDFGEVFKVLYLSKLNIEDVREIVESIAEVEEVIIEEVEQNEVAATAVEAVKRDDVQREVNLDKLKLSKNNSKNNEKSSVHHINQSIRVDLYKLDNFMNLVSELVIYRTRLEDLSKYYKTTEINEPLEHVARITSELQDLVLKIRMQPVNIVFNRFPRMIRDLSKDLDKEIELIIEGEETELDRTVVSELGEPLVHLIRNAADHGIEHADERLALNKPKAGVIKLTAYQEGNRVVITVSDDGKGIDPEVIRQSAEERGLNTEGMSERDLIQLIFNQGFSTAKEVTNVSGRGVGMDVVKQKITSLGGSIEVISEVNKGTTFVIKLPLTLSIIQALMVNIGEDAFAIPLSIIEKVVKVEEEDIIRSHNGEIYINRDKAIPVIRLNEKLGIESTDEQNKHIIIIMLGDQHYGLLVDDLIGQQEIVIKKLKGKLSKMKEYLGATILGNGDITLILDVGNLCSEDGRGFE